MLSNPALKKGPRRSLSEEIRAAGLESLDHDRTRRDRAEAKLKALRSDPRAEAGHRLNIDMALVGCAQRRGDHRDALARLARIKTKTGTDAHAGKLQLRATSNYQLGRYAQAAREFDQLLGHRANAPNDLFKAAHLLEAGRAFKMADRSPDAMRVTRAAIDILKDLPGQEEHLIRAKSNLATFMLASENREEVDEAIQSLEVLTDAKIAIGDIEGVSNNFSTLSLHLLRDHQFEKALAYARKDLLMARLAGEDRGLGASLGNLAWIYAEMRQLGAARKSVAEMAEIAGRLQNPEMLTKVSNLADFIDEIGRQAGQEGTPIGPSMPCVCGSGNRWRDCCGRADHEPVALRTPVAGVDEDVAEITAKLSAHGVVATKLDFAMLDSETGSKRTSWSETRGHDGWFEIVELPDMANIHLAAAAALADTAPSTPDRLDAPLACAMLAVSAVEAFINSTIFFAAEASESRTLSLPPELLADPAGFQRTTSFADKWWIVGQALCGEHWPSKTTCWSDLNTLVRLRNELVHFKAVGFEKVAPTPSTLPDKLKSLPAQISLREGPYSWPMRLLTPSFASWSVEAAATAMAEFRKCYRLAHHEVQDSENQ